MQLGLVSALLRFSAGEVSVEGDVAVRHDEAAGDRGAAAADAVAVFPENAVRGLDFGGLVAAIIQRIDGVHDIAVLRLDRERHHIAGFWIGGADRDGTLLRLIVCRNLMCIRVLIRCGNRDIGCGHGEFVLQIVAVVVDHVGGDVGAVLRLDDQRAGDHFLVGYLRVDDDQVALGGFGEVGGYGAVGFHREHGDKYAVDGDVGIRHGEGRGIIAVLHVHYVAVGRFDVGLQEAVALFRRRGHSGAADRDRAVFALANGDAAGSGGLGAVIVDFHGLEASVLHELSRDGDVFLGHGERVGAVTVVGRSQLDRFAAGGFNADTRAGIAHVGLRADDDGIAGLRVLVHGAGEGGPELVGGVRINARHMLHGKGGGHVAVFVRSEVQLLRGADGNGFPDRVGEVAAVGFVLGQRPLLAFHDGVQLPGYSRAGLVFDIGVKEVLLLLLGEGIMLNGIGPGLELRPHLGVEAVQIAGVHAAVQRGDARAIQAQHRRVVDADVVHLRKQVALHHVGAGIGNAVALVGPCADMEVGHIVVEGAVPPLEGQHIPLVGEHGAVDEVEAVTVVAGVPQLGGVAVHGELVIAVLVAVFQAVTGHVVDAGVVERLALPGRHVLCQAVAAQHGVVDALLQAGAGRACGVSLDVTAGAAGAALAVGQHILPAADPDDVAVLDDLAADPGVPRPSAGPDLAEAAVVGDVDGCLISAQGPGQHRGGGIGQVGMRAVIGEIEVVVAAAVGDVRGHGVGAGVDAVLGGHVTDLGLGGVVRAAPGAVVAEGTVVDKGADRAADPVDELEAGIGCGLGNRVDVAGIKRSGSLRALDGRGLLDPFAVHRGMGQVLVQLDLLDGVEHIALLAAEEGDGRALGHLAVGQRRSGDIGVLRIGGVHQGGHLRVRNDLERMAQLEIVLVEVPVIAVPVVDPGEAAHDLLVGLFVVGREGLEEAAAPAAFGVVGVIDVGGGVVLAVVLHGRDDRQLMLPGHTGQVGVVLLVGAGPVAQLDPLLGPAADCLVVEGVNAQGEVPIVGGAHRLAHHVAQGVADGTPQQRLHMDGAGRGHPDDLKGRVAFLLLEFHVHLGVDGRKLEGQNVPVHGEAGGLVVRAVGDQGDQIGFLEFRVIAGGRIVRFVHPADDVGDLAGGIQIIVHQAGGDFHRVLALGGDPRGLEGDILGDGRLRVEGSALELPAAEVIALAGRVLRERHRAAVGHSHRLGCRCAVVIVQGDRAGADLFPHGDKREVPGHGRRKVVSAFAALQLPVVEHEAGVVLHGVFGLDRCGAVGHADFPSLVGFSFQAVVKGHGLVVEGLQLHPVDPGAFRLGPAAGPEADVTHLLCLEGDMIARRSLVGKRVIAPRQVGAAGRLEPSGVLFVIVVNCGPVGPICRDLHRLVIRPVNVLPGDDLIDGCPAAQIHLHISGAVGGYGVALRRRDPVVFVGVAVRQILNSVALLHGAAVQGNLFPVFHVAEGRSQSPGIIPGRLRLAVGLHVLVLVDPFCHQRDILGHGRVEIIALAVQRPAQEVIALFFRRLGLFGCGSGANHLRKFRLPVFGLEGHGVLGEIHRHLGVDLQLRQLQGFPGPLTIVIIDVPLIVADIAGLHRLRQHNGSARGSGDSFGIGTGAKAPEIFGVIVEHRHRVGKVCRFCRPNDHILGHPCVAVSELAEVHDFLDGIILSQIDGNVHILRLAGRAADLAAPSIHVVGRSHRAGGITVGDKGRDIFVFPILHVVSPTAGDRLMARHIARLGHHRYLGIDFNFAGREPREIGKCRAFDSLFRRVLIIADITGVHRFKRDGSPFVGVRFVRVRSGPKPPGIFPV